MKNRPLNKNIINKISAVIRNERKLQGLTQTQLAEFAGVGLNFISQLECGKSTVRFDKALNVLNVLGIQLRLERGNQFITLSSDLMP